MNVALQKCVFQLLRLSMWQRSTVLESINIEDWETIFNVAKQQTIIGVIGDAIAFLPPKYRPTKGVTFRFLQSVVQVEKMNEVQNELIIKLFRKLKDMGLSPVLLKGQSLAANYPVPQHRQCGDIDIYFKNREECAIAIEWAAKIDPNATTALENLRERKHFTFNLEDCVVEFHHFLCLFEHSALQKKLQKIIDAEFRKESPTFIVLNGNLIETIPPTLSVIHQIIHITRHLLEAGIGLRQICDLTFYLNTHWEIIDKQRLLHYLKELQLEGMASMIGSVLIGYLGLDSHCVPFLVSDKYREFLVNEIFIGGNFGKNIVNYRGKSYNAVTRKIHSVHFFYKRCRRYHKLLPKESAAYFLNKIKLNTNLLFRGQYT